MMLRNVIYRSVIVPAHEAEDGETPSIVSLTQEVNCFLLWYQSHEAGTVVWDNFPDRDKAIEAAVDLAQSMKSGTALAPKKEIFCNAV